jgi:hypothetical protein
MKRSTLARTGVWLLIIAAACRPMAQPSPTDPADITGRVVDVRDVPPNPGGTTLQLLRVRVAGSHAALPGSEAIIGMDPSTRIFRSDAPAGDRPELVGAFVRIWTRGVPSTAAPGRFSAMARLVAVDSLPKREASR